MSCGISPHCLNESLGVSVILGDENCKILRHAPQEGRGAVGQHAGEREVRATIEKLKSTPEGRDTLETFCYAPLGYFLLLYIKYLNYNLSQKSFPTYNFCHVTLTINKL